MDKPTLIDIRTKKPEVTPAKLSDLLIVSAAEFGEKPMLYFARAWQSFIKGKPNGEMKFYMDDLLYNLPHPVEIWPQVTGWMYAPNPIKQIGLHEQLSLLNDQGNMK